mmetsp:Transcript_20085/g.29951  ORF Transcript_20085/g.29951 Transcript_20085/m.29951 type:complete len:80 (-) Transcript_20085:3977-4216(-)
MQLSQRKHLSLSLIRLLRREGQIVETEPHLQKLPHEEGICPATATLSAAEELAAVRMKKGYGLSTMILMGQVKECLSAD